MYSRSGVQWMPAWASRVRVRALSNTVAIAKYGK